MWQTLGRFPGIPLSTLTVMLALACGGGDDDDGGITNPPPPPPSSVAITTGDSPPPRFIPANSTVAAGGTVRWTNGSPVPHDLVATTSNWELNEDLPVGGRFETTIDQPGTYRYLCTLHENMAGTIVVK